MNVEQLWRRIVTRVQEHAPATAQVIRPPGPVEDVRHLQHVVGLDLPADLIAWWAVMGGIDDDRDYRAGSMLPANFIPLAAVRAEEEYTRLLRASSLDPTCCAPGHVHHKKAGDTGFPFCSALVPFCRAIDGCLLCVDLRSGDEHGRVMNWAAEEGVYPADWASVTDMLTEIADRLDDYALGRDLPPYGKHPAVNDEGSLEWF